VLHSTLENVGEEGRPGKWARTGRNLTPEEDREDALYAIKLANNDNFNNEHTDAGSFKDCASIYMEAFQDFREARGGVV